MKTVKQNSEPMRPSAPEKVDTERRPLPILYVIGSLDVGGTEGHLARIVPMLDRAVWAPEIYTFIRRGVLAESVESRGVPVHCPHIPAFLQSQNPVLRSLRLVVTFAQLARHLARNKPRLVHYFLPTSYHIGLPATFVAFALTAFTRPLPLRLMSRRSLNLYQRRRPFLGTLERLLHGCCSAVIGNSRAVLAELEDEGVRRERLHLIYNGIEIPPLRTADRPALRAALGFHDDAIVITQVANLIPYKGHADLIEAFAKIRSMGNLNTLLCIVGRDDGIGAELAARAEELGIGEHMKWLGARHDVADILAASDIGVQSSHQEGFSNAVLEGMAAGLPMVVTRVGGNPEAVIHGETGLVVEPHDPAGLAEPLTRLTVDATLRQRLGTAARKRVESCFSLSKCCNNYERLYASLLQRSAS